jgi:moderate conductance mechanosensitive channel
MHPDPAPHLASFQMLPQTVPADTLAAAQDTLTLVQRLRADTTLLRYSDPAQLRTLWDQFSAALLDPALWLGVLSALMHIGIILGLAALAVRLIVRVTGRWTRHFEALPPTHPSRQRAYTISNLVNSWGRYVIWPLAGIMALSAVGINVGALIATAGIAGLAIGFGAQTLVKDVISGIFLLFDDTIHVGDLVKIGDEAGIVEYIGIRIIKIRKFDGELLMVPAGELRLFGNRSIGFARVVVNVGLSYEQDVETVLPVMQRVADEWAADKKEILLQDRPEVQAIMDFADSSVNARIIVQVRPMEQFAAERDLRLLLKREFDKVGIEIPFPRRTVYIREDKNLPPRSIFDPDVLLEASNGDTAGSD